MKLLLLILLLPLPVTGQEVGEAKCSGGSINVTATCPADRPLHVYCKEGQPVGSCGGIEKAIQGARASAAREAQGVTSLWVSLFWLLVLVAVWGWKRNRKTPDAEGAPTPEGR